MPGASTNGRSSQDATPEPCVRDFQEFASAVLGWGFSPKGYAGTAEAPVPTDLAVVLPDYDETLHPDFAVRERDPRNGASPWQLLVQVLAAGTRLRQGDVRPRRIGGIPTGSCGAPSARNRGPRRCAVQRRRPPPDLCPPRRELRLDGLSLRGPDQYRRAPALLSAAPAAVRTAPAGTAPRPTARRPA